MTRPKSVTEADIARWTAELVGNEPPPELAGTPIGEAHREIGFVGAWVEENMRALGFCEDHIDKSKQSVGQIAYGRSDVWGVAEKLLELACKGKIFKPGRALAEALLAGQLNSYFGEGGTLRNRAEAQKMIEMMGANNLDELVQKFGCTSIEELKAHLQEKITEHEKTFPR